MVLSRCLPSFLLILLLPYCVGTAEPPEGTKRNGTTPGQERTPVLLMGGCGGAYLLASPGELVIDVFKQDLNQRSAATELRAILVGPDRHVIQEVSIPDDGRKRGSRGKMQTAHLTAHVDRTGVYALNITVSNDRYGQNMVWGLRTNCARYVIETARGHKDERHQEPIVLRSPAQPADICFHPRKQAFSYAVSGLAPDSHEIKLFDALGKLLQATSVGKDGTAHGSVPATIPRVNLPWRLYLEKGQGTLNLDGLTRWERGDLCPDTCCWSPSVDAWFPFLAHRWLLTPYSRNVYGKSGEPKRVLLRVSNGSNATETVRLSLEFPAGSWPARLEQEEVALAEKKQVEVGVLCTVPPAGDEYVCRVCVQPEGLPEYSTYSTIVFRAGAPPATAPLQLPLVLRPYRHENELFGYAPGYPVDWEPYFDLDNRPFIRTSHGLAVLRDGVWSESQSADAAFGSDRSNTKVAFDRDNNAYAIATAGGKASLLSSSDSGQTFAATSPGVTGAFDVEQFSGQNVPDGPPAVVRSIRTARDAKLRWRALCDLELFAPERRGGNVVIGKPVLLSRKSLGVGSHSGIPSAVVSRGPMVHIIWAEATDPGKKVPGVPTYVVTYDRQKHKLLGEPVLVGHGAPPNDVHNRPSLVIDSRGFLHALTGTHGQPFQYTRSLQPNTAHAGWTEAESVGPKLPQTYIGLVCGKDDTLHLVFRYWRSRVEPFPLATHATLAYQRKRPGQPWESPRVLVVAPFSEYSIFYHRLTIDRLGRLFVSYDYWSTYWFYRNDHVGSRRALMMSADAGDTWKLVDAADFR